MRSDFSIQAGRVSLAASREGQGIPLVCLHAGVCDRRMWHPLAADLCATCSVVAYDRRGFGGTPAVDEARSQVDDLLAVLDHLGLARAILVGCSQGGRIALDAALAHPDRVQALCLIAPAVSGAPAHDESSPAIVALIRAVEEAEAAGDFDRVNSLEVHAWLDGPLAPEGRVGGEHRQLLLEMNGVALRAAPMPSILEPPSAYDRLNELALPVMLLWGDLDFPYIAARCRLLEARIRGAQAHVIDGTAHLPTMERPERCAALLGAFANEVAGRP